MNCPHCHSDKSEVLDSRNWKHPQTEQTGIRRRRKCKGCNARFTTLEIIAVLTQDGNIIPPELNGVAKPAISDHVNGHKSHAKKPKSDLKKQLDMALHRARVKAVRIEDEDL